MDNKLQDIFGTCKTDERVTLRVIETLPLPLIGVKDPLATYIFWLLKHEM